MAIFAVFLTISCQHKSKTDTTKLEEKPIIQQDIYQTVDEQQAETMDQETQAAIEEVEVQDRIFFAYDSSELSPEAKVILDTQVSWLKSDPQITVTVEGHCDERGTREYNIALGEKRADSVKQYLTSAGIDSSRVKTISYGKERPAFFGSSPEIMAKNRRSVTVIN